MTDLIGDFAFRNWLFGRQAWETELCGKFFCVFKVNI